MRCMNHVYHMHPERTIAFFTGCEGFIWRYIHTNSPAQNNGVCVLWKCLFWRQRCWKLLASERECLIRVLPAHFPLRNHKSLHSHIWLGQPRQKQAQNDSWYNCLAARSNLWVIHVRWGLNISAALFITVHSSLSTIYIYNKYIIYKELVRFTSLCKYLW